MPKTDSGGAEFRVAGPAIRDPEAERAAGSIDLDCTPKTPCAIIGGSAAPDISGS